MTKRFLRPALPRSGLRVGCRDREILLLVARFRYLTAEHLRTLVAPLLGRRVFQRRLRLLFEHGHLERHRLPPTGEDRPRTTPVYGLGDAGEVALETSGTDLPLPARGRGALPSTIHHSLVAADFLTSVVAAARPAENLTAGIHPEAELWTRLARWRLASGRRRRAIVPDGAVSLGAPGEGHPRTYAIEVVRATVRGGNRTFIAKLKRYGELVRERFFLDAFSWARLRAVVVLTPSATRARHLRELAANAKITMPLLFSSYSPTGRAFTPTSVIGPRFEDITGAPAALVPAVCP